MGNKIGRDVPRRYHLHDERPGKTWKLKIGDLSGVQLGEATMFPDGGYYVKSYLITGEFEDKSLGEVFINPDKEGSFVSGTLDGFALLLSIALQHGIPLEDIAAKFLHSRFEPSGFTNDEAVPMASSFFDLIFRKLCLQYLDSEALERLGVEDRTKNPQHDCDCKEKCDGSWKDDDISGEKIKQRTTFGFSGEPFNRSKAVVNSSDAGDGEEAGKGRAAPRTARE